VSTVTLLFAQLAKPIAAAQIGHMGNTRQVAEARRLLAEARQGLYRLLAEDEPTPPENE